MAVADQQIPDKRYAVKCHVSLSNGTEAIGLWTIQNNKLNKFKRSIVGSYILTVGRIDELAIVKSHQCVPEENNFSNAQARQLDKNTPR
jgi:hypothetical protein